MLQGQIHLTFRLNTHHKNNLMRTKHIGILTIPEIVQIYLDGISKLTLITKVYRKNETYEKYNT
jgi:hypothetical protein